MNHPYLFPDQAEWTEDFQELKQLRSHTKEEQSDIELSDEELADIKFFYV